MISARELRELLNINVKTLARMINEGLPVARNGSKRATRFDLDVVNTWLIERGYASHETTDEQTTGGKICRTYAELARELNMKCRNPERVICRWVTQPGFPGRPSRKGIADGHLPVDEIKTWLANRETGRSNSVAGGDEEIRNLDRDRRRLALELEGRQLQEQLGRLADVDEVSRFNRQCVANAVAILEPLADEVVLLLPNGIGAEARAEIHRKVTELLDNARLAIAEMIEGDHDREDDDDEATNGD